MNNTTGFFRYPARFRNLIVFTYEDDIWLQVISDTFALRLTNSVGMAMMPVFSPDGGSIAYAANDEGGRDVYIMNLKTGHNERLTYTGFAEPVCYRDAGNLVVRSPQDNPHRYMELFDVALKSRRLQKLPYGANWSADFSEAGAMVIGRNCRPLYRWKRYRGGTTGQLWLKSQRAKVFQRLLSDFKGNLTDPAFCGERLYFLADHEGYGNLYSVDLDGGDWQRHSDHFDYYPRDLRSYPGGLIYACGGDIWNMELGKKQVPEKLAIRARSAGNFGRKRHLSAMPYLQGWDLDPSGDKVAITTRGQLYVAPTFAGAGSVHGDAEILRYRSPLWLKGGDQVAAIGFRDRSEEIHVMALSPSGGKLKRRIADDRLGRVHYWLRNPENNVVVVINHRQELWLINLETGDFTLVERNAFGHISSASFSPCGSFLAYAAKIDAKRSGLKICLAKAAKDPSPRLLINPVLMDTRPVFSPDGRFIYFIGVREFAPVYSGSHFQLSFPHADRVYGLALRADDVWPSLEEAQKVFQPVKGSEDQQAKGGAGKAAAARGERLKHQTRPAKESSKADAKKESGKKLAGKKTAAKAGGKSKAASSRLAAGKGMGGAAKAAKPASGGGNGAQNPPTTRIDWEGIEDRIFSLRNFDIGDYWDLAVTKDHLLVIENQNRGSLIAGPERILKAYHLKDQKVEIWETGISQFDISGDRKRISYKKGRRLRVVASDKKPDGGDQAFGRKSGWIDIDRFSLQIRPRSEWRCMYDEAWLLQKEFFWNEDMSRVEWDAVYNRYLPLLDKVSCRSELSDLIWEMQGELGTSHCYEVPSEQSRNPQHLHISCLGGKFSYDKEAEAYRLDELIKGDSWREDSFNPLAGMLDMSVGDYVTAINGRPANAEEPIEQMLTGLDRGLLNISFRRQKDKQAETRCIPVLSSNGELLYRRWVEDNRRRTHELSGGLLGYVHIPNMGPRGYSEFYRYFLSEAQHKGLVIDVRYNGGGHVSQHLLRMLSQKAIGYGISRWHGVETYPRHAAPPTLIALTNEFAGSDGDIFSHAFKLLDLGPLIGTRTWGGVIGIRGRHLVDGSYVSQPEFSHWFQDVGYQVENYGTDPDEIIDRTPNDFAAGQDPQLERAVVIGLARLKQSDHAQPDFQSRPDLRPPRLKKGGKGRSPSASAQ